MNGGTRTNVGSWVMVGEVAAASTKRVVLAWRGTRRAEELGKSYGQRVGVL